MKEQIGLHKTIEPAYHHLSSDQHRVIGDWYHFSILSLMKTCDFKSDIAWIANRLGLSHSVADEAMERLKRLEIVHEDAKGNLTRSEKGYCSPDGVPSAAIRLKHFELLQKARKAQDDLPVEERDLTSMTLVISPDQLPRAKEMIRKFQDELAAELETRPQSEVYQLCVQLFPLTQVRKASGKAK